MSSHTLHYPPRPGPHSFDQITDGDRGAIRELGRDAKMVIEVGTFLGGSAEELFAGMPDDGHLVTIDTFCGTSGTGITDKVSPDRMLTYAVGRLWQYNQRMKVIVGDSLTTASLFKPGIADVVFIDAGHNYEAAKADIEAWRPMVRPGGVLSGHDYDRQLQDIAPEVLWENRHYEMWRGYHPGVMVAVSEAFDEVEIGGDSVWKVRL